LWPCCSGGTCVATAGYGDRDCVARGSSCDACTYKIKTADCCGYYITFVADHDIGITNSVAAITYRYAAWSDAIADIKTIGVGVVPQASYFAYECIAKIAKLFIKPDRIAIPAGKKFLYPAARIGHIGPPAIVDPSVLCVA
jgi:hypothetical protein